MQKRNPHRIVVDIDGIITNEIEGWGTEKYLARTPRSDNIEILRDYQRRGYHITLHTARHSDEDYKVTQKWLKIHDVPYDNLIMDKPHCEKLFDDLAHSDLHKEVLCMSGGTDSLIAWYYLNKPTALYFQMGHRYQQKELQAIKNITAIDETMNVDVVDTVTLGYYEEGQNAYIPRRNFIIASIAANYGNKIYICGIKGDRVEDKTPEAFKTMAYALNFIKKPEEKEIFIESPFWQMTKTEVIKWFLDEVDQAEELLRASLSCYMPLEVSEGQCGACPACFRKWVALENAGIECLDWFENDITKWEGIQHYKDNLDLYDSQRQKEIKFIFDKYGLQEV